eukprot:305631-Amphidinium_carterae.1
MKPIVQEFKPSLIELLGGVGLHSIRSLPQPLSSRKTSAFSKFSPFGLVWRHLPGTRPPWCLPQDRRPNKHGRSFHHERWQWLIALEEENVINYSMGAIGSLVGEGDTGSAHAG